MSDRDNGLLVTHLIRCQDTIALHTCRYDSVSELGVTRRCLSGDSWQTRRGDRVADRAGLENR